MRLMVGESDNDRGYSQRNSDLGEPSGIRGIGRSEVCSPSHQFESFIKHRAGAF